MPANAYLDALKMLARRELSEAQLRQRLVRRSHTADAIEETILRLKEARAIDDARVAEAIARTEITVKRRGTLRVKRKIESVGIDRATAGRAVDSVVGEIDDGALVEAALAKRLRTGTTIADEAEFQRLYRYLIGQGFEPDQVMRTLNTHRGRRS